MYAYTHRGVTSFCFKPQRLSGPQVLSKPTSISCSQLVSSAVQYPVTPSRLRPPNPSEQPSWQTPSKCKSTFDNTNTANHTISYTRQGRVIIIQSYIPYLPMPNTSPTPSQTPSQMVQGSKQPSQAYHLPPNNLPKTSPLCLLPPLPATATDTDAAAAAAASHPTLSTLSNPPSIPIDVRPDAVDGLPVAIDDRPEVVPGGGGEVAAVLVTVPARALRSCSLARSLPLRDLGAAAALRVRLCGVRLRTMRRARLTPSSSESESSSKKETGAGRPGRWGWGWGLCCCWSGAAAGGGGGGGGRCGDVGSLGHWVVVS